jgi:hypothetical protein
MPESIQLLRDYLATLSKPDQILDLAASLLGTLEGSQLEQKLMHQTCVVINNGFRDRADLDEALKNFLRFSKAARLGLQKSHDFERIAQRGMLRRALTEVIADPLRMILGHNCRLRIWALPAESETYTGLLATGMKEDFRLEFEKAHRLPAINAGYRKVPDTQCLLLMIDTAEVALSSSTQEERTKSIRWYEEKLGLGLVVDQTYTWHFPMPPLAELADGVVVPKRSEDASWALSFDLGTRQAKFDPLLLKMVDRVIQIVGDELSLALDNLVGNGSPNDSPQRMLNESLKKPPAKGKEGSRNKKYGARRSANPQGRSNYADLLRLFMAGFACAPRTFAEERETPRLWVYAQADRKDPLLERLMRWIDEARKSRGPTVVTLLGPSGSGKGLLTRCIPGRGGRSGGYEKLAVTNAERFPYQLQGAEIGTWTGLNQRLVSPIRTAGEGVVHVDELLSIMAVEPDKFASAKGPFEEIRVGNPIKPHNGTEAWVPQAMLVINGLKEHFETIKGHQSLKEWLGRFGRKGLVPGWRELPAASRAVILRNSLLRQMVHRGARTAAVQVDAFRWLVECPEQKFFDDENMRGIDKITEYASIEEGKLYLRVEQIADAIEDLQKYPVFPNLPENEQWLFLGEGSAWWNKLNKLDKLVVTLAQLTSNQVKPLGQISEKELLVAVDSVSSQSDVFDLAYLMYAAVRKLSKTARGRDAEEHTRGRSDEDPDPTLTAPNRYQDFFYSNGPWREKVREYLSANADGSTVTPGDLKLRGPSKGRLAETFEKHVQDNMARLQAEVERLSCAFPTLYHVVPYWNWRHLIH